MLTDYRSILMECLSGYKDAMPDMFYYNFAGNSGRFVFDSLSVVHSIPLRNIKIEKDGEAQLNNMNGALFMSMPGWTITGEDGTKYLFDNSEETVSSSKSGGAAGAVCSWYLSKIITVHGDSILFNYENNLYRYDLPISKVIYKPLDSSTPPKSEDFIHPTQFVNSKKIYSIVFPSGKLFFFQRKDDRADLVGDYALDRIVLENNAGKEVKQFCFNYDYLVKDQLVADSIPHKGESVDLTDQSNPPLSFNRRLMLRSIVEKDSIGNSQNSGYKFEYIHDLGLPNRAYKRYDHWGYANSVETTGDTNDYPKFYDEDYFSPCSSVFAIIGKDPDFKYTPQGTLDKIIYPTGGSSSYEYEKNEANTDILTPSVSVGKSNVEMLQIFYDDYYNAGASSFEIPAAPQDSTRQYYTEFTIDNPGSTTSVNISIKGLPQGSRQYFHVVRKDDETKNLFSEGRNSISVVELPNGTYRLFFCPNPQLIDNGSTNGVFVNAYVSWDSYSTVPVNPGHFNVGGMRIKRITDTDNQSNVSLIRNYYYNNSAGVSSGVLLSSPNYVYDYREKSTAVPGNTWSADAKGDYYHYLVFNDNSFVPLEKTSESYVGYSFVTEEQSDSNNQPKGKTEYSFLTATNYPNLYPSDQPDSVSYRGIPDNLFPYAPADDRDWQRGLMTQETEYGFQKGTYQKLMEQDFNYTPDSVVVVSTGHKLKYTCSSTDKNMAEFVSRFYTICSGSMFPTSTITKEYKDNNEILRTITSSAYSRKSLLPVSSMSVSSKGDTICNYKAYPLDYPLATGFIVGMVVKNIVNVPIEIVQTRHKATGESIVSGMISKYNTPNPENIESVWRIERPGPILKANFKFSSKDQGVLPPNGTNTAFLMDSSYALYQSFDQYDHGRLVQYTDQNKEVCTFIWGYNYAFPIAKIQNVSYAICKSALDNILNAKGIADIQSVKDQSVLVDIFNTLRNQTGFKNVLVSSYTYDPLCGITSETDPRGVTTTYEYDGFLRLKTVKNADGKVQKSYDYHYRVQ